MVVTFTLEKIEELLRTHQVWAAMEGEAPWPVRRLKTNARADGSFSIGVIVSRDGRRRRSMVIFKVHYRTITGQTTFSDNPEDRADFLVGPSQHEFDLRLGVRFREVENE